MLENGAECLGKLDAGPSSWPSLQPLFQGTVIGCHQVEKS